MVNDGERVLRIGSVVTLSYTAGELQPTRWRIVNYVQGIVWLEHVHERGIEPLGAIELDIEVLRFRITHRG